MAAPEITPGQAGYLGPAEQTNWGPNPWQIDDVSGQMQAGQTNLMRMQDQMQAYGQSSAPEQTSASNYPSFPNSMGLGSQQPYPVPAAMNPQSSNSAGLYQNGQTSPWVFAGDANSIPR